MGRRLALIVGLSFLGLSVSPLSSEIKEERDRFTGATVLSASNLSRLSRDIYGSCRQPIPEWMAVAPDATDPKEPPAALLTFTAVCKGGWAYLECHSLHGLADGRPIVFLGEAEHRGNPESGATVERISVMLGSEGLAAIQLAAKLEFKLCNTEWSLDAAETAEAKVFARKAGVMLAAASPTSVATPPEAARACTQAQIDGMKSLGLGEKQIAAACSGTE